MRTTIILWFLIFFLSANSVAQTRVSITKFGNFSDDQRIKIEMIAKNLEQIINSKEFRDQVINYKINGEYRFEENNNESNYQIYSKIMSGYELLDTSLDNKWLLNLNLKWFFTLKTRAYTYFTRPEIYINSRYYNKGMDSEIAGTICHEYMHKVGYSHTKEYTDLRPYTVPYAIGDICEILYINNFNDSYFMKEESCSLWCLFKRYLNGSFR